MPIDRRSFLKTAAAGSAALLGLRAFTDSGLFGSTAGTPPLHPGVGPLLADPRRIFDLPEGFHYTLLSTSGDIMDDGLILPGKPDGMAAFAGPEGRVILVRNHELNPNWQHLGPYGLGYRHYDKVDKTKLYDRGFDKRPFIGGTSTLVFNPETQRAEKQFLSLAGTERNCAGGPTPWGTWITCEETDDVKPDALSEQWHGYNFEVPATAEPGLVEPVPLKAMGRFRHEAVAVDERTGNVYQTEDLGDGLLYRFIPHVPGELVEGGKLQALAIVDDASCDTRNWADVSKKAFALNQPRKVRWIDIDDVESPQNDLRYRGFRKGAAVFARGEGMWAAYGLIWFVCTNGGPAGKGQLFRLDTQEETLELFIEPNDGGVLDMADNITIAPWGDVILCEDGENEQFLRGVTHEGEIYTIARNRYNTSEICGACFSPDGNWLFLNIQTPGITMAINGPWERFSA